MNMNFKEWIDEKILVLMRGIPGSGKSTTALKLMKEKYPAAKIFSTDQFFHKDMDHEKPYVFDPTKLGFFHTKNLERAVRAMQEGETVIIDNTNTVPRDADAYVKVAHELGYRVVVHESDTPWKFDPDILAQRNQHGVPLDKIKMMIQRWTPHDKFVSHFKSKYPGLDIS